MAIGREGAALRELRTLYESGAIGGLTDGQLLERFATGRGEVAERAFAMLVERHGPMVLRVCRSVLTDPNDAQDAFQATFLVLLRKSRRLWVRDSLGPWLHQVALRTASCARSVASRRKRHEHRAAELAAADQARGLVEKGRDWEAVLHQEIERLPERHRVVVVLCDLEGQTHAQAARQLGLPVGTVKSRLARARERLRTRLIRRGLAPAAGLAAVLATESTKAAVPAALIRSTIEIVTNLTAGRAAAGTIPAAVTGLTNGALKTMMLARFRMLAIALPAIVAAAGAGMLAQGGGPSSPPAPKNPPAVPSPESSPAQAENVPVFEATTGKLNFTVVERGSLEATRFTDLRSEIEGETTILSIAPEGTRVKKGDLVCELDSARLREPLIRQEIATRQAGAAFENAKMTREVAEIARTEYAQGISKEERIAREGAIVAAKLAVRQAEDRLQRTRHAHQQIATIQADRKEPPTPSDILAMLEIADRLDTAEQAAQHEKRALEQAESKLESLEKYTRPRRDRELEMAIARAKADELAKQQTCELATARLEKLRREIDGTKFHAPTDGVIVYADAPDRPGQPNRPWIEEGAVVRERQHILSVVDLSAPMRVNAKVQELWVDQIKPEQQVRIQVDAFPNQVFSGVVEAVAPRPDPLTDRPKVYSTRVRIEQGSTNLRPGMTAEVRILVGERDQVVRVPVQAIARFEGQDHVAVKTREGDFAWRVVTLGLANEEIVEVREGLQDGDLVAADPAALMTEEQRQARFRKPARRARPPIEK